jgi:hypothetical protein
VLDTAHDSAVQVALAMTPVGPLFPAGSVMVTAWVAVADLPHTSVAVRTTVYVPGAA